VSDGSKIFGDRETALILQKAAELQAERGGRTAGLSLDELRQIAGEAGIDPHLVDDALAELRRPVPTGAPARPKTRRGQTRWEQRLELPVRLDLEDVRAVLAHLEAEFGGPGAVTELSCGTVWTHLSATRGHTHAAIEARDSGTSLHVAVERGTQRTVLRRLGTAIGGGILGVAGLAIGEPAAFFVLTPIGLGMGNLVGRGAWKVVAHRWTRRLDRLVSTLSGEALRNGTPVADALQPVRTPPQLKD
jgi:hypothetical protein